MALRQGQRRTRRNLSYAERSRSRLTDYEDDVKNQQRMMQEIADNIGVDVRDAALGIQLARTGRADLISAVISGRLTIRAALARAETSHASSRRAAVLSHGSK
jgi:hypothetical protein